MIIKKYEYQIRIPYQKNGTGFFMLIYSIYGNKIYGKYALEIDFINKAVLLTYIEFRRY